MSNERVPTILVNNKNGGGTKRINEADFDKTKHSKLSETKSEEAETTHAQVGTVTGDQATQIAPSAPVIGGERTGHPGAHAPGDGSTPGPEGDGERRVMLSEPVAPAGTVQHQVAKMGSKYFVVDSAGNKVDAEGIEAGGYKNEAEAWKVANPSLAG